MGAASESDETTSTSSAPLDLVTGSSSESHDAFGQITPPVRNKSADKPKTRLWRL
jgi:hypothetical protein